MSNNKNNCLIENIYPLSPMQSGLLFQALYAPSSDAYFVQSVFELEGEVDTQALQLAWQTVSNHHPILRTGIIWEDGEEPAQYTLEYTEVPFMQYDWQNLRAKEQEKKLEKFIQEDRKKGFDLSQAPLFRITLFQCGADKHYLIWSHHHILTDGWSTPIILGDVFKAYEDVRQNIIPQLTSRRPYRDYIVWLQHQNMEKAEDFWKEYLVNIEEPTRLSFKDLIQENLEKDYDNYSLNISIEETNKLKKFAQEHNLTLNTILQGVVGLVLKTYTQRPEVIMGITVSGRSIDLSGIEEMVGLFINTLPLKIAPQPNDSILSFLTTLKNQTQELNEYAYTSLAQIQSWSNINQSLFDVIFVFENYPVEESISTINDSFKIKDARGIEKTEYPLTIVIQPKNQLYINLAFQTKHFNEEIIERFSSHIKKALHYIIQYKKIWSIEKSSMALQNLTHFICDLSLLTASEQHQLLIEWNDTKADYPEYKTIHQLFEEQVEKTPNNVAVVYENQELTYQQLNERANQLAHYLRSLGVSPDILVAIAVEQSLEMIIGLLGILKAGGAYVPLDPDYPPERLQFMLEDTKVSVLITQAHLQDKLKKTLSSYRVKIIAVDQIDQILQQQKGDNPTSLTLSHHLAYTIYTSGSTGKPKGVLVNHENLANLLDYFRKKVNINPSDVFLGITTFTFDIAGLEVYLPLLKGSKLLVANKKATTNPSQLIKLIDDCNVTIMQGTPSTWQMLLESHWLGKQDLRILCGGEAPTLDLINKLLNKANIIWNVYGPTETTIWSSSKSYSQKNLCTSLSIGHPISNTQIYILDSYINPVPIGVSGEIYIGGDGLARGYLNRADLTAEKFIPNLFMNEKDLKEKNRYYKSLRLYCTGDLARYLPNGNIEFLGRIDDQVKIRGFRIELGEIESALTQHNDVSQAVVIARKTESGYKQLVAYVVPQVRLLSSLDKDVVLAPPSKEEFSVFKGESISFLTEDLRNHLFRFLPDYMIPAFFVFINKIPLTSNGKINRKALASYTFLDDNCNKIHIIYPETNVQFQIFNIWKNVLNLKNISIHDNFFNIGGNSLSAIKVVSQLQQHYFNKVFVADIFKNPTIHSLARTIELECKDDTNVSLIPIQPSGKAPYLFLMHPGGGLSFCYMGLAKYISVPVYAINNPYFKNIENGFTTIEEMAEVYISLIKLVQKTGPYLLGGWSFGGIVAYEMGQQLTSQGEKVENIILIDVRVPINNLEINFSGEEDSEHNHLNQKEKIAREEDDLYLKPIMDQNLHMNKEMMCNYKIKKYKGNLTLIKALDENTNKKLTTSIDYGWSIFVENIGSIF